MRPHWLKVGAARANISEAFQAALGRDNTMLLDIAGGANEQNGECERHGQWFERLREGVASAAHQGSGDPPAQNPKLAGGQAAPLGKDFDKHF